MSLIRSGDWATSPDSYIIDMKQSYYYYYYELLFTIKSP